MEISADQMLYSDLSNPQCDKIIYFPYQYISVAIKTIGLRKYDV